MYLFFGNDTNMKGFSWTRPGAYFCHTLGRGKLCPGTPLPWLGSITLVA